MVNKGRVGISEKKKQGMGWDRFIPVFILLKYLIRSYT